MPFKKKKGTVSPVNILREYVSTYMYWVKTGKEKFRHKKEIGPDLRGDGERPVPV